MIVPTPTPPKPIWFDTTLRDGALMPGVSFSIHEKVRIASLLDAIGVDAIEVGYPGRYPHDREAIAAVAGEVERATVCALAGDDRAQIEAVAEAIAPAKRGRIHTYTNVNLPDRRRERATLDAIERSISLARHYCSDIQWSAFDATRADPDFLDRAIATAIAAGAKTVNLPDSLGIATPEAFRQFLAAIAARHGPNQGAIFSVHCHDDLGHATDNAIVALEMGARQLECAIEGLGARKGNTDLRQLVYRVRDRFPEAIDLNLDLLEQTCEFVRAIVRRTPSRPRS
ncbi:2-isopropylmalate synthase [Oxynema sp. CENA135]|uniref:2-isopropylmalate synthase n=1 Tax=Oxynema sp. CENA135 TaxID=984206 RepID=UPI00190E2A07|nr:2-isopropylmalate synthase [Oxynema sp. CENA135]MBK4730558.1 2-isopropylmalate synthase [Oxynema sp. CENA135]